jgi:hypothetical protein
MSTTNVFSKRTKRIIANYNNNNNQNSLGVGQVKQREMAYLREEKPPPLAESLMQSIFHPIQEEENEDLEDEEQEENKQQQRKGVFPDDNMQSSQEDSNEKEDSNKGKKRFSLFGIWKKVFRRKKKPEVTVNLNDFDSVSSFDVTEKVRMHSLCLVFDPFLTYFSYFAIFQVPISYSGKEKTAFPKEFAQSKDSGDSYGGSIERSDSLNILLKNKKKGSFLSNQTDFDSDSQMSDDNRTSASESSVSHSKDSQQQFPPQQTALMHSNSGDSSSNQSSFNLSMSNLLPSTNSQLHMTISRDSEDEIRQRIVSGDFKHRRHHHQNHLPHNPKYKQPIHAIILDPEGIGMMKLTSDSDDYKENSKTDNEKSPLERQEQFTIDLQNASREGDDDQGLLQIQNSQSTNLTSHAAESSSYEAMNSSSGGMQYPLQQQQSRYVERSSEDPRLYSSPNAIILKPQRDRGGGDDNNSKSSSKASTNSKASNEGSKTNNSTTSSQRQNRIKTFFPSDFEIEFELSPDNHQMRPLPALPAGAAAAVFALEKEEEEDENEIENEEDKDRNSPAGGNRHPHSPPILKTSSNPTRSTPPQDKVLHSTRSVYFDSNAQNNDPALLPPQQMNSIQKMRSEKNLQRAKMSAVMSRSFMVGRPGTTSQNPLKHIPSVLSPKNNNRSDYSLSDFSPPQAQLSPQQQQQQQPLLRPSSNPVISEQPQIFLSPRYNSSSALEEEKEPTEAYLTGLPYHPAYQSMYAKSFYIPRSKSSVPTDLPHNYSSSNNLNYSHSFSRSNSFSNNSFQNLPRVPSHDFSRVPSGVYPPTSHQQNKGGRMPLNRRRYAGNDVHDTSHYGELMEDLNLSQYLSMPPSTPVTPLSTAGANNATTSTTTVQGTHNSHGYEMAAFIPAEHMHMNNNSNSNNSIAAGRIANNTSGSSHLSGPAATVTSQLTASEHNYNHRPGPPSVVHPLNLSNMSTLIHPFQQEALSNSSSRQSWASEEYIEAQRRQEITLERIKRRQELRRMHEELDISTAMRLSLEEERTQSVSWFSYSLFLEFIF